MRACHGTGRGGAKVRGEMPNASCSWRTTVVSATSHAASSAIVSPVRPDANRSRAVSSQSRAPGVPGAPASENMA